MGVERMMNSMARRVKASTFEQLNKTIDGVDALLLKGLDFGEFTGASTEYHGQMVQFKERVESLLRDIEAMETTYRNECLTDIMAPLLAQANGDADALRTLVAQAVSTQAEAPKEVESERVI